MTYVRRKYFPFDHAVDGTNAFPVSQDHECIYLPVFLHTTYNVKYNVISQNSELGSFSA
jgi:hypothetical protein